MFVHIPVCTYTHPAMVLYTVVVDNPHHHFAYLFVAEFCYIAQAGLRLTMYIRLALNLPSSFLVLPRAEVTAMRL